MYIVNTTLSCSLRQQHHKLRWQVETEECFVDASSLFDLPPTVPRVFRIGEVQLYIAMKFTQIGDLYVHNDGLDNFIIAFTLSLCLDWEIIIEDHQGVTNRV